MNPITEPSNVAQRIARAEADIAASNARLHALRQHLRVSARHTLRASRKPLVIGGIALVATGLLLYPRRHAIASRVRLALHQPMVQSVLHRLPMVGVLLPMLITERKPGERPSAAKLTALLSAALPLMSRFLSKAPASRASSAH
jgi:hypothetical protein